MRVLSIDGGGYLGLATAAFIRDVEDHFGCRLHEQFDLFCGTSAGAILALALACGKSGAELVALYTALGASVFGRWGRVRQAILALQSIVMAKYKNAALRDALGDTFGMMTVGQLLRDYNKMALVTAFCTSTGAPRVFKTDHSPNLSLHSEYRLIDIALASSAAPTYFPLVQITNPKTGVTETFCDGGVVANHPALLGYAEAISELGVAPSQVRLLSLSTPRTDLREPEPPRWRLRRGAWRWKNSLASILIDSNSSIAHEVMDRIASSYGTNGPRYERIHLGNKLRLPIDRADAMASRELMRIGSEAAANRNNRQRLEWFVSSTKG